GLPMRSIDRALERREAERQQERATEWSIVLRRASDAPAPPLLDGNEAFYNLLQPSLGYYPRVSEIRDNLLFTGDEDGRGVILVRDEPEGNPRDGFWGESQATSVGVEKASLDVKIEHECYAVLSADRVLHNELIFKLRSDEPWEAQQRWWQIVVGAFERLGYADATLAHWQVIELLKTLRSLSEL